MQLLNGNTPSITIANAIALSHTSYSTSDVIKARQQLCETTKKVCTEGEEIKTKNTGAEVAKLDVKILENAYQDIVDMFGSDNGLLFESKVRRLLKIKNGNVDAVAEILDKPSEAEKVLASAIPAPPFVKFVQKHGKGCGLPGSFVTTLGNMLLHEDIIEIYEGKDDTTLFMQFVRHSISGRGDICGVLCGVKSIPVERVMQTNLAKEVLQMMGDILCHFPQNEVALLIVTELLQKNAAQEEALKRQEEERASHGKRKKSKIIDFASKLVKEDEVCAT